jgi:hypothetical protein
MAKVLITEASGPGKYGMAVMGPSPATQAVTYTTSTQSTAFGANTNLIRVIADADVYLEFGLSPAATANSVRVLANTVEYFGVNPGDKVACYDGSS